MSKTHARLSGSKADRWMNCPASVTLGATEHGDVSGPAAKEGTEAHLVAEMILRGWAPPLETRIETMVKHAEAYERFLDIYQTLYPGISDVELEISGERIDSDTGCILDFVHTSYGTNTLIIVDYKYGEGIKILPEENSQLLYGAALLLSNMGRAASHYTNIILGIYQPRGEDPGGRIWRTDFHRVMAFKNAIVEAVKAIKTGTGELHAGDWCRWCLAKSSCREYYTSFVEPVVNSSDLEVNKLKESEVERLLDLESKVSSFYSSLRIRTTRMAALTGGFANRVLAPSRGNSFWINEANAESVFPAEEMPHLYKRELRTPVQLKKLYPELIHQIDTLSDQRTTQKLIKLKEEEILNVNSIDRLENYGEP